MIIGARASETPTFQREAVACRIVRGSGLPDARAQYLRECSFGDKSGAWRCTRVGLQGAQSDRAPQWSPAIGKLLLYHRPPHLERLGVRVVIEVNVTLRTLVTIRTEHETVLYAVICS